MGCANNNTPLLEDATHLSLGDIVNRIACEAAEPIREYLVGGGVHQGDRIDLEAVEAYRGKLAARIGELDRANRKLTANLEPVDAELKSVLKKLTDIETATAALRKHLQAAVQQRDLEELKSLLKAARGLLYEKSRNLAIAALYAPQAKSLKKDIDRNADEIDAVNRRLERFNGEVASRERYLRTEYSLGFEFNIAEQNKAKLGGSLKWSKSGDTKTLAGSGIGPAFDRASLQNFVLNFTANDAIALQCGPQVPRSRLARPYPITGHVGIGDFVRDHAEIYSRSNSNTWIGKDTVKTDLTFTTELVVGATPSLSLSPGTALTLTPSLELGALRKDIHKLSVRILTPATGAK